MPKLHCHLCGATLRRPEQFHELARPDHNDVIHVCRDETRCVTRATYDLRSTQSAERLPSTQKRPIRVHEKDGGWQVDYGSYAQGYHRTREGAIEKATTDAVRENRALTIDDVDTTG